jgi:hypothetical protein
MADLVTVRAGWALWGKEPGTRQDYSVLACSAEPFSRTDFAAIITRFAAGSPDASATGPAALPWVTVSWVGVDDDPHLGISITGDSGQVDGVGRPITQTSYFCVPYAQLARTPVSYCDLYDTIAGQAAQIPLLRPDGPMIQLTMPAMSQNRLADAVRRTGEQTVTATAAMLLSGPVSVVQAESTSLRDRLEFIDAVASLLPHGYRVRFSGATWSDTGAKHRVRLAFAARPREDAAVVHWRRTVDVPATDRLAAAYFDRLRVLVQDPARSREGLGLPAIIGHLATDTEPRTFDKPQQAMDSLYRLDQPFQLLRAVRDRTGASLDDLRQLFRLGRARELPDEADVAALLANFAGQADVRDWAQLRRELSSLRSKEDRIRILTIFGRRMLWTMPQGFARAAETLRFASEFGPEDAILADLIRQPEGMADQPVNVQRAAELLADTVLSPRGAGREFPRTRDLLAGAPGMTAEFVVTLSRSGWAGSLLRWLDPQGVSVLSRAFSTALGINEGWVSDANVAELGTGGADCVRLLLQAASHAGNLDPVLPGFTKWLAGRGELGDGERGYWVTHLSGLDPRAPQSRAWLDTALLMCGGQPSGLPPTQLKAAVDYGDAVVGIWTGLHRAYSPFNAEGCAHALAGYLSEEPWTTTAEQALGVSELVKRLHDFDPGRVLATTVASALAATPAARNWDFAQGWLTWAAANEPEAVRGRLLDSLAAAPPGADPGYLAGLCTSACAEGIDPDAALLQLVKSGALTSAMQAAQLFNALGQQFDAAGIGNEAMLAWQFRLSELFARGEFGAELGHELRVVISDSIRQDLWLQLRLLAIFAEEGQERQCEWTEAEHKDLTAIGGEIESMLKRSRKAQRPRKLRLPFGSGPGEIASVVADHGQERSTGTEDTVTMPPRPE